MKTKLIIIWSLLFILIISATLEQILVVKALDKMKYKTTSLINKTQNNQNVNTEEISTNFYDLCAYWKNTEYKLCFIFNHNNMQDIGDALCSAKTYLENNDKDNLLEKLGLVLFYSDSYKEVMTFSIQNLI